jgi:tetratricopeptide (TPR) repeat protein
VAESGEAGDPFDRPDPGAVLALPVLPGEASTRQTPAETRAVGQGSASDARKASARDEVRRLTAILEADPANVDALVARARKRVTAGDLEAAVDDANRAIEIDPASALAHYARGNALADMGRADDAVAEYDRAIELDPTLVSAFGNRGDVYAELGDLAGAISDYDRAIELDAGDWHAHHNRGYARSRMGQYGLAIPDYDRAIELDPANARAYVNRGNARMQLGQSDLAFPDYDRAIELDPFRAAAYNDRGYARSLLGQDNLAIADYDRALELDPTQGRTINNRAMSVARLAGPHRLRAVTAPRLWLVVLALGQAVAFSEYQWVPVVAIANAGAALIGAAASAILLGRGSVSNAYRLSRFVFLAVLWVWVTVSIALTIIEAVGWAAGTGTWWDFFLAAGPLIVFGGVIWRAYRRADPRDPATNPIAPDGRQVGTDAPSIDA